ncbi:MAG: hypothetical protein V3U23_07590 [Kiloniellales bacterium]
MGQERTIGEDRLQKAASGRVVGQTAGAAGKLRVFDLGCPFGPVFQTSGGARGVGHPGQVSK